MKNDPRLLLGKPVRERILAEVKAATDKAGRVIPSSFGNNGLFDPVGGKYLICNRYLWSLID